MVENDGEVGRRYSEACDNQAFLQLPGTNDHSKRALLSRSLYNFLPPLLPKKITMLNYRSFICCKLRSHRFEDGGANLVMVCGLGALLCK